MVVFTEPWLGFAVGTSTALDSLILKEGMFNKEALY